MLQRPTGNVTFLFTDIEGSTKLWESNAEAMRKALACHDAIVRASIEANGGYVFKTIGDAFCAAFAAAPEAIAADLEAQQSLSAERWEINPPLRVRMAVHTGSAEERDGDYFGQPVNRVARLLSAGHGGQTLLSTAAHEMVRDALPPGCLMVDMGISRLKDLAAPERIYQLQHFSLPSEFPPLKTHSSDALPNNLPQQISSFVGRDQELAEIEELLVRKRLLTLVGTGGAGKTRLALQAAADLLDSEGDGVWLVELAPLSEPSLVASALAQALGIKEAAGEPIRTTLVNSLKAKRLLIVLDNCEHVLDACCSLATDLLRSCPGVRLLATSREPLNVAGEQVYRVPSMSIPSGGSSDRKRPYTLDSLFQYDSVRLFIERAKAVQPTFAVTGQNAPAVAHLCRHLDGIPLAIELAAARVRSIAVDQVNARLDTRFRLLTGGSRTSLPRQQTLKALIDWSYDLLSDQEKAMLAGPSVFAGGWTLEAAEQVCAGNGGNGDFDIVDLLTSLADKSLVVYEQQQDAEGVGAPRYRLLETIRQYARERLQEGGASETGAARQRHGDWCVALAEEAEPHLTGAEQARWLSCLEIEHDNLRAALAWCEAQGGEQALRLSAVLSWFWNVRGHYSEGRQWIARALECAETLKRDGRAQLLGTSDLAALQASALNGAGNLAFYQGDYPAARALLQESLEIARRIGDEKGIASLLNNLRQRSL